MAETKMQDFEAIRMNEWSWTMVISLEKIAVPSTSRIEHCNQHRSDRSWYHTTHID
jgi:hypothetical protein